MYDPKQSPPKNCHPVNGGVDVFELYIIPLVHPSTNHWLVVPVLQYILYKLSSDIQVH